VCLFQEQLRQAITQVTNIIQWVSPDSVSSNSADSLVGQSYDVILYYIPPFVKFEDRDGLADPVSGVVRVFVGIESLFVVGIDPPDMYVHPTAKSQTS